MISKVHVQPPQSGSFRRGELKHCIRANFDASSAAPPEKLPGLLDLVRLYGKVVVASLRVKEYVCMNLSFHQNRCSLIDIPPGC